MLAKSVRWANEKIGKILENSLSYITEKKGDLTL